jgi:hypothetical protein
MYWKLTNHILPYIQNIRGNRIPDAWAGRFISMKLFISRQGIYFSDSVRKELITCKSPVLF